MSEFGDFDAMYNENSLDILLRFTSPKEQDVDLLEVPIKKQQWKLNCGTHSGIWDKQQSILAGNPLVEEASFTEMATARKDQESKIKQFIQKIKPISNLVRKISLDVATEAGSPKKKKIRKLLTNK